METVIAIELGWIALMITMAAGSLGHMAESHDPEREDEHEETKESA